MAEAFVDFFKRNRSLYIEEIDRTGVDRIGVSKKTYEGIQDVLKRVSVGFLEVAIARSPEEIENEMKGLVLFENSPRFNDGSTSFTTGRGIDLFKASS